MGEWPEVEIHSLGEVITGKTPSKSHPEDWGDLMPFITPTDYKDFGKIARSGIRNLSKEGIDRLSNKVLPKGSVMVTCIGSDMGKIAINGVPVITNQQINSIIPNSNNNGDFIYYRLVSIYDVLRSYGGDGTAVPIVNKGDFSNIKLLIPSDPEEQKAIAGVLSSLDDKIDLLHRQNKTLESLAETLFRQTFIENAEDDWEEKKVSDIAEHVKINVKPHEEESITFYHYSLPAFDASQKPVTEEGSSIKSNKYKVVPNSVLVSKLNPRFPRIWPIDDDVEDRAICSTEFQVFVPLEQELYGFLLYLFKSDDAKDTLEMAASGTSGSHQRVTPSDMLNIGFSWESKYSVAMFSERVHPLIQKDHDNKKQIQTLEKLRDTLLPKLMSGEIRVQYDKAT